MFNSEDQTPTRIYIAATIAIIVIIIISTACSGTELTFAIKYIEIHLSWRKKHIQLFLQHLKHFWTTSPISIYDIPIYQSDSFLIAYDKGINRNIIGYYIEFGTGLYLHRDFVPPKHFALLNSSRFYTLDLYVQRSIRN